MAQTDLTAATAPATGFDPQNDRSLTPALQALLHWFSTLTPTSLADIGRYYTQDCHFRDPFNDVHGLEQTRHVYAHMFATTESARFVIERTLHQQQDVAVFWRFRCRVSGRDIDVGGMSALRLDAAGRIADHVDYWDSADLFAYFPVVGTVTRWLKRKLALPPRP